MVQKRLPGNARVVNRWKNKDGTPSSINGKGKKYAVRWIDNDGKQRQKNFTLRKQADEYKDELIVQFSDGSYVSSKRTMKTIGAVHQEWQRTQVRLKESTQNIRDIAWRVRVKPKWESILLSEISRADVLQWVADLQDGGDSPESIEIALGVLRMVLQYAIDDNRLRVNPCDGVSAPRRKNRPHPYLNVKQVEALADNVKFGKNIILTLAYTGLRWGEVVGMPVRAIDFENRRISIFQTLSKGKKGRYALGTPKTHEMRSVPFPARLDEVLKEACKDKGSDDLVFTSPEGEILRGDSYRPRYLHPALEALQASEEHRNFPKVTLHDLRHTAASLAVSSGANVKAVQRMLGHKSAAMTLDTYADLFDNDLDEVAARMDELIKSETGVGEP